MYTIRTIFYLIFCILPLLPESLSSAQAKDICLSIPYLTVLANYPPAQEFCRINFPVKARRDAIREAVYRRDGISTVTTTKAATTSSASKKANAKTTPTADACDSNCQALKALKASAQDILKKFCSCIQSPSKTTTTQATPIVTLTTLTSIFSSTEPTTTTNVATTTTKTTSATSPKCTREQHIGASLQSCFYYVCDDTQYLGVPFYTVTADSARACASQGARAADAIDWNANTMICRLFHGADENNIVPAPGVIAGTFGGCPDG